MLDKLGKRRFALPLLMIVLVGCVFAAMMYPMANMQVKDLSFGALNLDEGVTTPAGEVNAGAVMLEGLTAQAADGGDGAASPFAWTAYATQEELDEAFADGMIYGALVLPSDFSAKQAAVKMGTSDEPAAVQVLLDMAKSPMIANMLQTSVPALLGGTGLEVEVTVLNAVASSSANPLAAVMSQNFIIMPLVLVSCMMSMLTAVLFAVPAGTGRREHYAAVGRQYGYALALSMVVALVVLAVAVLALNVESSLGAIFGFGWISSFCVMCLVLGAANVALPLGVLVMLCVLTGTACGILPAETLPAFWQDWVYPWAPQHYVGDGLRDIMYRGAGAFNDACLPLALTALAGMALACLSPLVPQVGPHAAKAQ